MISKRELIDRLLSMKEDEIIEVPMKYKYYLWIEHDSNGDDTYGWCIELHNTKYKKTDTICKHFGIYAIEELDYLGIIEYINNRLDEK